MKKVIVTIRGGVGDLISAPKGQTVIIRDYDLEGVDVEEHVADPDCGWVFKKDKEGDWYQEIEFTGGL